MIWGYHHLKETPIYLKAFHVSVVGIQVEDLDTLMDQALAIGDVFFFEDPMMGSMGRMVYLPTSIFQGVLFGSKGWCMFSTPNIIHDQHPLEDPGT